MPTSLQVKFTQPELIDHVLRRCADEFMSPTEYVKRLVVADFKASTLPQPPTDNHQGATS